jgi:thiol-disulfide isomerase/thioredoxin
MKNKFITSVLLLAAFLLSTLAVNAQESRKLIAVINKADWCAVCQATGEKMMKEVMPVFNESNVEFVMNDLTNDATKAESKMGLDKVNAYDAVKKISSTGWLLLVDAGTGKLLDKISVVEPSEKLVMAIKKFSLTAGR